MSESVKTSEAVTNYIEYSNTLLARIHELETALLDATFLMGDWAAYVDPYFIEKHDLKSDLAKMVKIREVLNRGTHEKTALH